MPINIGDHRWMAQDDLSDGVIQNIAAQLVTTPTPGSGASAIRTRTVAASAGIAATETLLLASPLLLPTRTDFGQVLPGTINIGTLIRWTIQGTCTDTGANTTTFGVRMGILGTTSDAAVATFVSPASGTSGTNIPFTAIITLTVQTLTATGTGTGQMLINSVTAGILGTPITFNVGSAAAITALPTTTATFIDLTLVSAASTTTNTIQSVQCEIFP